MGQPLLQHLVDFLGGIKYVPPPSSEAKVHKGEPIFNKEKEEERPKRGSAVAFEAGIEPASSKQVVRDWEQVPATSILVLFPQQLPSSTTLEDLLLVDDLVLGDRTLSAPTIRRRWRLRSFPQSSRRRTLLGEV